MCDGKGETNCLACDGTGEVGHQDAVDDPPQRSRRPQRRRAPESPAGDVARTSTPSAPSGSEATDVPVSEPDLSGDDERRRIRGLIAQLDVEGKALEANDELKKCGEAAVPDMLDSLANESLQGWLVPLLGRTGDRRAMEPLRVLVESGTDEIRSHAAAAIGNLGIPDPAVISTLIEALEDEIAQFNAVYALNRLGPEPARAALKRVAETSDDVSLTSACKAIFFRLDGDIESIARMMKDDNYQVGSAAIGIVEAANTEEVRTALAEAARSAPQELVRMSAMHALKRMNEAVEAAGSSAPDHHARLESDSPGERRDAVQMIAYGLKAGSDSERDLEALLKAMADSDQEVRATTRTALVENREAIPLLIAFYQKSVASDPKRACLAGRVLGSKMEADLKTDMIPAQMCQIMYGLDAAFISCVCGVCGAMNKGIPVPPRGPMVPYYGQSDDQGAYAIPVVCDKCGDVFYVAWDSDPR